jgi:hypothetical protein
MVRPSREIRWVLIPAIAGLVLGLSGAFIHKQVSRPKDEQPNAIEPAPKPKPGQLKAAILLARLRTEPARHEEYARQLVAELDRSGLTLSDIGTTEAEIEQWRVRGHKATAQHWLKHLRRGGPETHAFARNVRRELEQGGLTLAEISTSEAELTALVLPAALAAD